MLAYPAAASAVAEERAPTVGAVEETGVVEAEGDSSRPHDQHGAGGALQGTQMGGGGVRQDRSGNRVVDGEQFGQFARVGVGAVDADDGGPEAGKVLRDLDGKLGCCIHQKRAGDGAAVVDPEAGKSVLF